MWRSCLATDIRDSSGAGPPDRSVLRRLDAVSIYSGLDLSEDIRGTNGIGTVVEELSPVAVVGAEHYAEALAGHVCVGVPIRHPLSRRFEGVLALSCTVAETSGLLLSTAAQLAERIEDELSAKAELSERLVFESFIARCRRTPRPIVAVTDRYMLTNAPAAERVDADESSLLWDQLAGSLRGGTVVDRILLLRDGTDLLARCTPVEYGGRVVGAIAEFDTVADDRSRSQPARRPITRGSSRRGTEAVRLAPGPAGSEFFVIVGPPGSGRRFMARAILRTADPAVVQRHPAPLVQARGPQRWLTELDRLLAADRAAVVISDVDVLDDLTVQGLIAVLEQHSDRGRSALRVVLTSSPCERAELICRQLSAVSIEIPPLGDRREEIPQLCGEILDAAGLNVSIGKRAMSAMMNYSWRGDVAELKTVLLRAASFSAGHTIFLGDFERAVGPAAAVTGARRLTSLENAERQAIMVVMDRCGGNKLRAASELGIARSTLYKKLRQYHLEDRRQLV